MSRPFRAGRALSTHATKITGRDKRTESALMFVKINVARAATYGSCHRCGTPTLTGYDDDILAIHVTIDAAPFTDPKDEGAMLLAGHDTFNVEGRPPRYVIWRRRIHHYGRDYPIHRSHRCGAPPPASSLPPLPRHAVPTVIDNEPPF